jgi:ABC-type sugar transport system ATPase subunit
MIEFQDISIRQNTFSLRNISFVLMDNKYYCMVGRTGAGKTTLLEVLCGLRKFESGKILINGEDVSNYRPGERSIGYVPQDLILFNHMSVYDNIGFSLKIKKVTKSQRDKRIRDLAELLGISDLLERKPHDLSGGEKQRVAIGRAISFNPNILLLDEPFSALDKDTKLEMYKLMKLVQSETNVTLLHVTHNTDEVKYLAEIILIISDGKIFIQNSSDYLQEEISQMN